MCVFPDDVIYLRCEKAGSAKERKAGYRCAWCGLQLHKKCAKSLPTLPVDRCTFGDLSPIILRPWYETLSHQHLVNSRGDLLMGVPLRCLPQWVTKVPPSALHLESVASYIVTC